MTSQAKTKLSLVKLNEKGKDTLSSAGQKASEISATPLETSQTMENKTTAGTKRFIVNVSLDNLCIFVLQKAVDGSRPRELVSRQSNPT